MEYRTFQNAVVAHSVTTHITILGSGAWGRAFGCAIADQCRVTFWDRDTTAADNAAKNAGTGANAVRDFGEAIQTAELLVVAVSSGAFAEILARLAPLSEAPVAWLTKGFDPHRNQPLSAVAAAQLGDKRHYAAISGPSFAEEVEAGLPTALALSANHPESGLWMQSILHRKHLRLYLEEDLLGVCIGGAVKNIIAIAAGISDAMQLGENARAALITRGLAEMSALCEALGGQRRTLLGLVGVGDLTLTCSSAKSRNHQLGIALGKNPQHVHTAADIAQLSKQTCEGALAIKPVLACLAPFNLETPIINAVADVLGGRLSPAQAGEALLARRIPSAAGE